MKTAAIVLCLLFTSVTRAQTGNTLDAKPSPDSGAGPNSYAAAHGGGTVNLTQKYNCQPLTADQYAFWKKTGTGPDSTVCIQSALNAACAGLPRGYWFPTESILMLEPGTYLIGNPATEGLTETGCTLDIRGNGLSATRFQAASNARLEDSFGNAYQPEISSAHHPSAWNPTAFYGLNQLVSRNSGTYIAIAPSTGVDPYFDQGKKWVQVYSRMIHVVSSNPAETSKSTLTRGGLRDILLEANSYTTDLFYSDYALDDIFLIEGVGFRSAAGDNTTNAIKAPTWLNGHILHSRYDGLGGYAAAFPGWSGMSTTVLLAASGVWNPQAQFAALNFEGNTYDNNNAGCTTGVYSCAIGDGIIFVDFTYPKRASVTAFSISSGTVTIKATNSFSAGQLVYITDMMNATYLNGFSFKILRAGLSSSAFEFTCSSCADASGRDSGTATVRTVGTQAPPIGTAIWKDGRIEVNQQLNSYYTNAQTGCSVSSPAANCLQRSLFRVLETDYLPGGAPRYQEGPLITLGIENSPLIISPGEKNFEAGNVKIVSSDVGEIAFKMSGMSYGFNEEKNNDTGTDTEAIPFSATQAQFISQVEPFVGPYNYNAVGLSQITGVDISSITVSDSSPNSNSYYKPGTLILNKSSISGTANAAIYQVNCPTNGSGVLSSTAVQTQTGSISSGSTLLTLNANPAAFMLPAHGITIDGAGAGGAALSANILFRDDTGRILTLDTAASTTVSGAALANTRCSLLPAVQAATILGSVSPGKILANCGTMTTTAATSDSLPCSWVTAKSACSITPTNSSSVPWSYTVPRAGSVTVYHAPIAAATYAVSCSSN